MSRAGNQQRTLLELLAELRPFWRTDRALPARIQAQLARRRAFGSHDRRLYRELIYTALRYLPWIEPLLDEDAAFAAKVDAWLAADEPATARFRAELLDGWPACPAGTSDRARLLAGPLPNAPVIAVRAAPAALLPAWFRDECPDAFEPAQLDVLQRRAPLWVRVQRGSPAEVAAELGAQGIHALGSPVLPGAIRVNDSLDLTKLAAYREGRVEVQDLGSQFVLASVDVTPGGRWLDACAGAGGKTLQLAQRLGAAGHVDAHDVRPDALAELAIRAKRAGVENIAIRRQPSDRTYDGVLVDAPCSGSGTWRRAPHLKWTTSPAQITTDAERQRRLLREFGPHVRPGGLLVYATCSLCQQENETVAAGFLSEHPDFTAVPPARDFGGRRGPAGLTLFPALHDTDGFFVATFRRSG